MSNLKKGDFIYVTKGNSELTGKILRFWFRKEGYYHYHLYDNCTSQKCDLDNFSKIKANALDGSKIDFIADGQSNTIVLFFATWCIDCRRELPVLQSHSALLNKLNTKVYLISDEDINTLTPFSTRLEAPFQLLKLEGSFKESGIYTLPTAFLYCKDGSIHLNKTGAIDWTEGYLRSFEQACK